MVWNGIAWLAVNRDRTEVKFSRKPIRDEIDHRWVFHGHCFFDVSVKLPKGSIRKLIGRNLTWSDEPVLLT